MPTTSPVSTLTTEGEDSAKEMIKDYDDLFNSGATDDYDDKMMTTPIMTTDRPHPHPSQATTPTPSLTSQHGLSNDKDAKLSNYNQ